MKELNISDSNTEETKKTPTDIVTPTIKDKTQDIKITSKEISKKKGIIIIASIALILILSIASFYYFGIYKYNPNPPENDIVKITTNYIKSNFVEKIFSKVLVDNPEEPRTEVSPINGLLFTKSEMSELMSRRPVAVMINNHVAARPTSGLNSADVVYETLVESGITRHMAIFWSQAPAKVGPVRSARQQYIEWLSPFDAIYIHDGCASSTDPRVNACGNLYTYRIKDLATAGAWRWNDGVRYAPHNEYNSILSAWEYAEDRDWDGFVSNFETWKFKNDNTFDQRGDAYRYKITFHERLNNSGDYDAIWQYEPTTNTYNRWIGGRVDIDQETNTQVNAKTIIIQNTEITPTYDEKGHVIVETIGQGDAIILMDGKEIEGTWKKTNRTDRTTYYDSQGVELQFNRGRIWISVIAQSTGKFDIIEQ